MLRRSFLGKEEELEKSRGNLDVDVKKVTKKNTVFEKLQKSIKTGMVKRCPYSKMALKRRKSMDLDEEEVF